MNQARSRPDFDPPEGDRHGRWTAPTPTSLRNQKLAKELAQAEAQKQAQKQAQYRNQERSKAVRERELNQHELDQIEAQSRAGLVRSAAAQQLHRSGAARAVPRVPAWLPPKDR
jgi:hypothetical protein